MFFRAFFALVKYTLKSDQNINSENRTMTQNQKDRNHLKNESVKITNTIPQSLTTPGKHVKQLAK
jgi:hypothetical protein